jgi:hypothetical protein
MIYLRSQRFNSKIYADTNTSTSIRINEDGVYCAVECSNYSWCLNLTGDTRPHKNVLKDSKLKYA